MDESGVLHFDPSQPFFTIGALIIEDTLDIVQEMSYVKRHAVAATGNKGKSFEFKFKKITRLSRPYYERLIDLVDFYHPRINLVVVDKTTAPNDYVRRFPYAWDAYVEIARLVVQEAVNEDSECVVIADFVQKPHLSHAYLEPRLKSLPQVRNATMLESHASMMIQLIDILTGCVVYHHRIKKFPGIRKDPEKLRVSNFLAERLGLDSLAAEIKLERPFPFQVQWYNP